MLLHETKTLELFELQTGPHSGSRYMGVNRFCIVCLASKVPRFMVHSVHAFYYLNTNQYEVLIRH